MLHILATIYFSGTLLMVLAGMAVTIADDWAAIRGALTAKDVRKMVQPWPSRVRRVQSRQALQVQTVPLCAAA